MDLKISSFQLRELVPLLLFVSLKIFLLNYLRSLLNLVFVAF